MEAQMRIILFLMVIISSATEEVKNLISTEGGSITLPDPVKEKGYLSFKGTTIAAVNKGEVEIEEKIYINRLHWDKNTGFFTITGLQRNDSGIYYIDSKKGRTFTTSYNLIMYESVSTPAVKRLSVSAESCILLCSVEKAEETTLLWYKDKEILNQSSSALSLLLTVHKQDSNSSYSCVAANPADNKTLPVNITTSCSEQNNTDNSDDTNTRYYFVTGIIISIVLAVFVVLIAIITKKKCLNKTKTTTRQTQGRFGEHRHKC
ncbi:CD48 antigen-like isoform X2 [Thunnus thynnus]|uniref:CD48 antigen-like isoform X2 n=1 Tax=Thunnus thynnus TaxID=8237 RepID=UPI003527266D